MSGNHHGQTFQHSRPNRISDGGRSEIVKDSYSNFCTGTTIYYKIFQGFYNGLFLVLF